MQATALSQEATAAAERAMHAKETAAALSTRVIGMESGLAVLATSEANANQTAAAAQTEASDAEATIETQATQIAELELLATANALPTDTPTPPPTATPTATPTPQPTPTSPPQAGDALYAAGKKRLKDWPSVPGWKYVDGMLVSDSSGATSIQSSFSPGAIPDYALEADIQFIRLSSNGCDYTPLFGIYVLNSD